MSDDNNAIFFSLPYHSFSSVLSMAGLYGNSTPILFNRATSFLKSGLS